MEDAIERAARLVGYLTGARYSSRGEFLFKGISLKSASVLELGWNRRLGNLGCSAWRLASYRS
jgi:hypothetical protein